MNGPVKPTQRTKPGFAPVEGTAMGFRRLEWSERVRRGDYLANERLGLELWEGPPGFQAGSFAMPIYRKEEPASANRAVAGAPNDQAADAHHRCNGTASV